jgi:hypothetical protein
MACHDNTSVFGPRSQYIKTNNGDFIAINGANVTERQVLSDLRIPYKQIIKGRVVLKPGQINFLLNFFSLGDNATFLSIKATYDTKSVYESDNYITWNYYNDLSTNFQFSQLMILTGNSTKRIPQLYLTNPNPKHSVTLEVMVAVIDDQTSYFSDIINQSGRSFVNLHYTDIHSFVVGQSIIINDENTPPRPLVYFTIVNIEEVSRYGTVLTIRDSSLGPVFLSFVTLFDAEQANSLFNYILNNPSVDIDDLSPVEDIIPPVIYFNSIFAPYGDFIALGSGTYSATSSVPYNSTQGLTFSTDVLFSSYTSSVITGYDILSGLVHTVIDSRDGVIGLTASNLIINDILGNTYSSITSTGSYIVTFDFTDIAGISPGPTSGTGSVIVDFIVD